MATVAKAIVVLIMGTSLLWLLGFQVSGFGYIIVIIFGLSVWNWVQNSYLPNRHVTKLIKQQQEHEANQQRLTREADEARARAAQELRQKHDSALNSEQSRLEDEAAGERVRSIVSEMLECVTIIRPETDKNDILSALHSSLNRLVESKTVRPHHFTNDMLQFDVSLIIRKLDEIGLGKDAIVERICRALHHRKVIDGDAKPATPMWIKRGAT